MYGKIAIGRAKVYNNKKNLTEFLLHLTVYNTKTVYKKIVLCNPQKNAVEFYTYIS